MRLIGNKTKLLGSIQSFLEARGVHGGTFLDVFAGTASVGRHFRRLGYKVRTNDLLKSSYARQRAYICLARAPHFKRVRVLSPVRKFLQSKQGKAAVAELQGPAGLCSVVAFLNALEPAPGLIARQYAAGGVAGRLYFSKENGAKIDAVHGQLMDWRRAGALSDAEFYVLLSSLLEAVDRVANISGTYGAFLKKLQTSAREPLRLRPLELDPGPAGRAYNTDANELVRRVDVDVLYLDPPYNHRQYAKNYHVLEVLAELHTVADVDAYEAEIYGKTGLLTFADRRSEYCRRTNRRRGPSPCALAFADLVKNARAEHIVVSYSEEGILSRDEIGAALAQAAGTARYDFARDHEEVSHKRFRSDRERAGRSYRVLEGRARDEVAEWLFYVRKPRERAQLAG